MKNHEACLQALKLNTLKLNKTEIQLEEAESKINKLKYKLKKGEIKNV